MNSFENNSFSIKKEIKITNYKGRLKHGGFDIVVKEIGKSFVWVARLNSLQSVENQLQIG